MRLVRKIERNGFQQFHKPVCMPFRRNFMETSFGYYKQHLYKTIAPIGIILNQVSGAVPRNRIHPIDRFTLLPLMNQINNLKN
jgi:hypothetical protein